MNNFTKKVSVLLLFLLSVLCGYTQEKIVHGVVTTFDSIPLISVEVKVQSTKQVCLTDTLGRFSIACNEKDKLKVNAEGFYPQKVEVKNLTKVVAVNLKLRDGEKARDYAIGYTRVSDHDKLNSLASLNSDELDFSQYANIYDLIRGKFAGVQIINGEIVVRGIKPSGNSAALIIVDGVSRNSSVLSALAPSQVKSINVIKDGSSSIYGIKGANGVVIIEMKKGEYLN